MSRWQPCQHTANSSKAPPSHIPKLRLQSAQVEEAERTAFALDQPLLLQLRHFAADRFALRGDQRGELLLRGQSRDHARIVARPLADAKELGREALLGREGRGLGHPVRKISDAVDKVTHERRRDERVAVEYLAELAGGEACDPAFGPGEHIGRARLAIDRGENAESLAPRQIRIEDLAPMSAERAG